MTTNHGGDNCHSCKKLSKLCGIMVEVTSCIRGLYVWEPCIGEELVCSLQDNNPHTVCKAGAVIGHVPRLMSRLCWLFLKKPNTAIKCFVTGSRRY